MVALCVVLGLLAASPEAILDPRILRELGFEYSFRQSAPGFVPCAMTVGTWLIVWLIQWRRKGGRDVA